MTPQNLSAPTNRAYLLEARRLRNIFMTSAGGMETGKEGGKEQGGGAKKGGRVKAITFPELMCCMWAALGTNEKFSNGASTPVRLSSFNTDYKQRVIWMKEQDKWRDQHGKPVTDITPEESIDLRIHEVTTKTKQTPISYQQARVVTVCINELASLLDAFDCMLTPTVG